MVTVTGASAVQKQSLENVLQNSCQACNFTEKRPHLRAPFLQNTSTLGAASDSKEYKPVNTYTERLCCRERNDIPERYF